MPEDKLWMGKAKAKKRRGEDYASAPGIIERQRSFAPTTLRSMSLFSRFQMVFGYRPLRDSEIRRLSTMRFEATP